MGGGVGNRSEECPFNGGDFGKTSVGTFSNPFLKILTKGVVSTETGSLFQYFTKPHRKCLPSPSAVASSLEYLVGVPS